MSKFVHIKFVGMIKFYVFLFSLLHPCNIQNMECDNPYSFLHRKSFTANTAEFKVRIKFFTFAIYHL